MQNNQDGVDYGKQADQYDWIPYVRYPESRSLDSQESFVINVLRQKTKGYFVEVGSNHPFIANNTSLLESKFDWSGVALDIDEGYVEEYNESRKTECVLADAMSFDYASYFKEHGFPQQIDYLQIDIDDTPRHANLKALIQLPLAEYRFSVITIEHGVNTDYTLEELRRAQRTILTSYGYQLVVQGDAEDWWVDPMAVPGENYWTMFTTGKFTH
jgi:hypothetical protein